MATCYIFGAGASYGYNSDVEEKDCPPLTEQFLVKAREQNVLTEDNFPSLREGVVKYLNEKENLNAETFEQLSEADLKIDIEKFLGWSFSRRDEFSDRFDRLVSERILEGRDELEEELFLFDSVIGETYFFIYELLRRYPSSDKIIRNNYRKLLRKTRNEDAYFISLNYDVLLECAAQKRDMIAIYTGIHDKLDIDYPKDYVPVAKVHGSINWINPTDMRPEKGFSNSIKVRHLKGISYTHPETSVEVYSIDRLRRTSYREFLNSNPMSKIAIVPPLAENKNFEEISDYKRVWKFAGEMLSKSDEVVFIGCSVREQDEKFIETLENNLRDNVKLSIFSGRDSESIESQLEDYATNPEFITDEKVINSKRHFDDYIQYIS
ncbi:hypothetical protein V5735_19015 [Haladaptatus sp. SPP-AMP-3]|uniref:hypothetical protein n=1 Tax=Haladaptatus sp. SPP-AMP-3 TaxID=3121295 RepID=UPI003C2C050F